MADVLAVVIVLAALVLAFAAGWKCGRDQRLIRARIKEIK